MKMEFKIDKYLIHFFQAGKESKGGDAILIRLFDIHDKEHIFLIDGGYQETGKAIVNYIKSSCSTNNIDAIFNTHPDLDHISGLKVVLEDDVIKVDQLFMNRPWRDAGLRVEMFNDNRITPNSLIARLRDAFVLADDLERIAKRKGVSLERIQASTTNYHNLFKCLGPTKNLYRKELLLSDKTPESFINDSYDIPYTPSSYQDENYDINKKIEWFDEEETSPINETSVVLLLELGEEKLLFTGDSGKKGLNEALDFYENKFGGNVNDITLVQLPHHGSRKNINPDIISRFREGIIYIISCPPKGIDSGHPSRRLINKILEIDSTAKIFCTTNTDLNYYKNIECRGTVLKPSVVSVIMDGKNK